MTEHTPRTAMTRDIEPSWLRPKEWRQATGMPHTTTQRLLRSGAIRAVRVGDAWYIRREEVEDFFTRTAQAVA